MVVLKQAYFVAERPRKRRAVAVAYVTPSTKSNFAYNISTNWQLLALPLV